VNIFNQKKKVHDHKLDIKLDHPKEPQSMSC